MSALRALLAARAPPVGGAAWSIEDSARWAAVRDVEILKLVIGDRRLLRVLFSDCSGSLWLAVINLEQNVFRQLVGATLPAACAVDDEAIH